MGKIDGLSQVKQVKKRLPDDGGHLHEDPEVKDSRQVPGPKKHR